ncbi:CDP-6-deoxy-L-threo-D-glycero-4-hexulose-3-dehydrase reductase [Vibrio crassostreae]|uniref:FAD-binding oxidoreductase n=1 Tax=Vibrio crassostreae TaxID=246167 RepID=UPI00104CA660|nr:FAD-binding oxidoreductase [Vibrio crassostreae]TCN84408.1 CDP-4-dehydro-6-deoxyglucose reductase [Vibrio crassostreae]CAK2409145.1 CDP-6-deoxy-L-threo-D-glycero-4-hexulose-3-dehydrase reductase [Vibrio crassostreae]CAK2414650.1 CDP-6-deoxy-L-threo-D-glycero-4-hexulose-3-dehydrase reductase [Vibrio crassostreae]CAK3609209.1 CDP-6-deoxy-L-threo-D-glycero-4-hexulose-3-dehydrase reductase [Vibrio crassostreae]CAK3795613.1 CDP-6-deoxy-L-threo-D-glycero-4-hexulose-3-dehydrase reductase [Vibrio c
MKYNIEIQPSGMKFKSENNLLEDALSQSIPLEYSCKTGDCGTCNADIVSGEVENECGNIVNQGEILICQSKAKSNVILKANYYPELVHIKQQTVPCKVTSFKYVTEDIVSIKLRFPPTAKFDYLPGQYVDLIFKGIKRSYSIANAKSVSKELELHIRKVPNGKMSELLFEHLKDEQLMRIEGPKGTFFVKDNVKPLILIATGTGIAPIKAIVEELIEKGDKRDVYIYWGMQFQKELYCNELVVLANNNNNISFTAVLSREPEPQPDYQQGYVQNVVVRDFNSLNGFEVYACGSLSMIEDAKALFLQYHLPVDAFFSDAFTPAK